MQDKVWVCHVTLKSKVCLAGVSNLLSCSKNFDFSTFTNSSWKGGNELEAFLLYDNAKKFHCSLIVPLSIFKLKNSVLQLIWLWGISCQRTSHISYHRFQIWLPIKTYFWCIWILSTIDLKIKACNKPYSKNSSSIFFAIASFVINVTCDMCNCHVSKGHTIISSIRHKISKSLILMMKYGSENPTLIQFLQKGYKPWNQHCNQFQFGKIPLVVNCACGFQIWWPSALSILCCHKFAVFICKLQ